jgi:hypothetical protein
MSGLVQRHNRLAHLVISALASFSDYSRINKVLRRTDPPAAIYLAASKHADATELMQLPWCEFYFVIFSSCQTCVIDCMRGTSGFLGACRAKIAQNDRNACAALKAVDNSIALLLPIPIL